MTFKDLILPIHHIRGFDTSTSFVTVLFISDIIPLFMYNLLLQLTGFSFGNTILLSSLADSDRIFFL